MRKFLAILFSIMIAPALCAVSSRTNSQSLSARGRAAVIAAPATRKTATQARSATVTSTIRARAADTSENINSAAATTNMNAVVSRTGTAYDQCKTAYFTCMDQFCAVKNEKYRRCSCSNKIYDMDSQQKVLESAAEQLNDFNSGLDAVKMTAAQATATKTASEGELAMAADKSASKRLLDAIMNSISGSGETKVGGGVYEQLNALSFTSNQTGADTGQQIASYNGETLYSAIYSQCREVVRTNCSDDALQRAVTAYLMAVENDCGTVAKMIEDNRNKMVSAVNESSAMLNLARVENRQTHNASDASTCLNDVETAITDEQVCGANYKKCLDNGEFIDKETGNPFTGVKNFYELGNLLTFNQGTAINDQKLSTIPANRTFVQNFTNRNKKFAEPALDKCTEIADSVWSDYLDKAMLEIHYAQANKVDEIKRGCFDFVQSCYVDGKKNVTDFMKDILDVSGTTVQPETISLTSQLCDDYIQSCNKMFGGTIVSDYIAKIDTKDTLTTCRNVAKECFDTYGGTSYNNFYNPASGLFAVGEALDWFTLYSGRNKNYILSPCARRLLEIPECSTSNEQIEQIFGGFDKLDVTSGTLRCIEYGLVKTNPYYTTLDCSTIKGFISTLSMRNTGVATEIYNIITGKLRNNCVNYHGQFTKSRYLDAFTYCTRNSSACGTGAKNPCMSIFTNANSTYYPLKDDYHFSDRENICPYGYTNMVDTSSWGVCSCWKNGGRRPDAAGSPGCYATIPTISGEMPLNSDNKVCPFNMTTTVGDRTECACSVSGNPRCNGGIYDMKMVPIGS